MESRIYREHASLRLFSRVLRVLRLLSVTFVLLTRPSVNGGEMQAPFSP